MRDWAQVAREELARRGLDCGDEVASELGTFLDDAFQECVAGGADPERATELALSRAGDWAQLARGLECAEEVPMERAKRLWIPGLVNAVLAFGLLRAATATGLEPFVRLQDHGALVVYWQWLPALPVFAAFVAWWSARRGGLAREQLIAGLFPSLAMLALMLLGFVVSNALVMTISLAARGAARAPVPLSVQLPTLGLYFLTWVVVPGVLSFLGAIPLVIGARRKQLLPA